LRKCAIFASQRTENGRASRFSLAAFSSFEPKPDARVPGKEGKKKANGRDGKEERKRGGGETRGFRIGVCLPSPRRKCRSEWQLRCGRRGRESSQELLTLRQLSSHRPRITTRFNVPPPEKSSRTRANGVHFSERVAENSSRSPPCALHAPLFPERVLLNVIERRRERRVESI